MELTVQNVYGLLLRSKLLSIEEARGMYTRWQEESKDASGNLARFAAWMVANRYLTEYQATLLARGHADGFFLNDYKILDRLGKGRMAGVYRAQHELGQIVAIKVLPPSKAQDPNMLSRFHREARLAMKLKHPNIFRAFQLGQAAQNAGGTLHYMVMEYLDGETLEDVLFRRGKFPPTEAVRLVHQALQGLQHIHSHGLVHRDLKPSNLMLIMGPGSSPDNTLRATLKILDLGLGRALFDANTDQAQGGDEGLTSEGVLLGTPDYMAPEQARDARGIDIRADIYSLGCVLYHLLAGRLPFPDTNLISQMIRHATETPAPLKDFNPSVPDGLQQIVNWMLAKDPNQRYPTPERAAQALQVFLAAGAAEALAAPEADPKMRPYLTWLEINQEPGETPPARPAPAGPLAATIVAPTPLLAGKTPPGHTSNPKMPRPAQVPKVEKTPAPAKARPGGKPGTDQHKVYKEKPKRPAPPLPPTDLEVDVQPLGDEGEENADVELLTLPEGELPARDPFELRVDRRDFVMFGLGVLAGGLAVGVGCWLALRRRGSPPDPDKGSNEDR
jgi:eukaryotic-like serine/threonine-protein kinase